MRPRARAWQQEKPPQCEACTTQLESSRWLLQPEKSLCSIEDPAQSKIIINKVKKKFFFKMHQILDNCMCSHIYGECEFYKGFFLKQEAIVALWKGFGMGEDETYQTK